MKIFNKLINLLIVLFLLCQYIPNVTAEQLTGDTNIYVESNIQNGSISVNKNNANANETISIEVNPDPGYKLKEGSLKFKQVGGIEEFITISNQQLVMPDLKTNIDETMTNANVFLYTNQEYLITAAGGGSRGGHIVSATVKYQEETKLTTKVISESAWVYDKEPDNIFKSVVDRDATLLVGAAASRDYSGNSQGTYDATVSSDGMGASSVKGSVGWYDGGGKSTYHSSQYVCGTTKRCEATNCATCTNPNGCTTLGCRKDHVAYNGRVCAYSEFEYDRYCDNSYYTYIYGAGSSYVATRDSIITSNGNVGLNTSSAYINIKATLDEKAVIITAEFEPIEYTINYEFAGGLLQNGEINTSKYTIESAAFLLYEPVMSGATFIGYTITNDEESFKIDTETMNVEIPKGTYGNLIVTANWSYNPYYLLDDQSNIGVSFEDSVIYNISNDIVLNPIVEEHYFLYEDSIQVKLSDTDLFVDFTEDLKWKASNIIVKATTEYESVINIKSDEIRKFLIENDYLPYHKKGGQVIEPYNNDLTLYQIYTIDRNSLNSLNGKTIDLDSITINNLENLREFSVEYNVTFINIHISINQDIIDQYESFDKLIEDLLDVGITDITFEDCNLEKFGDIILPDKITDITLNNVISGNFEVNNSNTTINKIEINDSHIKGDLVIENDTVKEVIINNTIIDGNVLIKGDLITDVSISDTIIKGDLIIEGDKIENVEITDTIINGDVTINTPNCENVDMEGSTVEGDLVINGELITKLNLSNSNIDDDKLAEIDFEKKFPNLIELDVSNNNLTKFDVDISNLQILNASNNNIVDIDTTKYNDLISLDLSYNNISSIDLSGNANLSDLNLDGNKFTSIDLSAYTSIKTVSLNNQIIVVQFDIAKNKYEVDLTQLDTNLDVEKITGLSKKSLEEVLQRYITLSKGNGFTFKNGKISFKDQKDIKDLVYTYDSGLANELHVNLFFRLYDSTHNSSKPYPYNAIIYNMNSTDSDGIRISIVDTTNNKNNVIYTEDYSNRTHWDANCIDGIKSKLSYKLGDKVNLKCNVKYLNKQVNDLPKVVGGNQNEIKKWLLDDKNLQLILKNANISYEDIKSMKYQIVVEPIMYFIYNNQKQVGTPTQISLWDLQTDDDKNGYGKVYSLSSDLMFNIFPNSIFPTSSQLGFMKQTAKSSLLTNEFIIENMGINFISFEDPGKTSVSILENYDYRPGTDVYTSIYVSSDKDRVEGLGNAVAVRMESKYFNCETTAEIPAHQNQLVWCKWTTPNIEDEEYKINVYIDGVYKKTIISTIKSIKYDVIPDTNADDKKPSNWSLSKITNTQNPDTMKWSVWRAKYIENIGGWSFYDEDGSPIKDYYSLKLETDLKLSNDKNSPSNSGRYIKSGYGIEIDVVNTITGNGEHTKIQTGIAVYPEYEYKNYGDFLEGGINMQLPKSNYSITKNRVHFTPIWYPDNTKYTVKVKVMDLWTPAGMLNTTVTEYKIVKGSLWDDRHIGKN